MCRASALSALLAASFVAVPAARSEASPPEECPGAVTWEREHPKPNDGAGTHSAVVPAEAKLLDELRQRVTKDQAARKRWLANQGDEALADDVGSIDADNLAWLRALVSEKGFPTAAQVGNEGVHFAWVLLQHADGDPKLQADLLPVLEQRFSAGELPANDLARLTDRILVASDQPQRYGTQFDWFAGTFTLPEANELGRIDEARARLGLMPLTDYVCVLRKAKNAAMKSGK
jgi:hypothetical protein